MTRSTHKVFIGAQFAHGRRYTSGWRACSVINVRSDGRLDVRLRDGSEWLSCDPKCVRGNR